MSLFPDSIRRTRKHWGFTLLLLLFGLALEATEAEAQSGRRAVKPATPAAPVVTPEPTPEVEKPLGPGELPAKVHLLVARQPTSKHLSSEDQIFGSFIKQLNRYENIEAISIGDLKESRAVERAKAESEAFVILMKFDIDSFQNGTIILGSQDIDIEYYVLAPRTGKKQTTGKVYFQSIGGGRMRRDGWPNGTPIRITPEGTGIEAADGLYFWLKLAAVRKAATQ
ncbi:MAG TPA: hypothetical protein VGO68_02670 [Pyrinomonadaceae bacterium]|jgi:hypothetical protein|nr:hypothetical protein [Pyrinomonadaceae bacterium]